MKKFENDVTREIDRLRGALAEIKQLAEQIYAQGATPHQRRERILEIATAAIWKEATK